MSPMMAVGCRRLFWNWLFSLVGAAGLDGGREQADSVWGFLIVR